VKSSDLEREEMDRYVSTASPVKTRTFRWHCPRCQRGVWAPRLLRRPHWREDGPAVCESCVRWEAKWNLIERERSDFIEHMRGLE
jgi:hypothetical protein